jgi:hypothetical protein
MRLNGGGVTVYPYNYRNVFDSEECDIDVTCYLILLPLFFQHLALHGCVAFITRRVYGLSNTEVT